MRAIIFSLTLSVGFLFATPAQSQPMKTLGKIAKWAGQTIATSAVETFIGQEIEQRFYAESSPTSSYSNNSVQISITNDYPYYSTYFWISGDGQNWYPYMLYPGQYLTFQAGQLGVVGVFNGSQVHYFNQSGSFFASQFFY